MGNSISLQALALLLGDDYDIITIGDSTEQHKKFPFYPFDIKTGILKQFLNDTGLNKLKFKKSIEYVNIFANQHWFKIGCNLSDLEELLKVNYKEEKDNLDCFFVTIKIIGQEWENFISNQFNSEKVKFIQSSKYMYSLNKAFDKFGIKNTELKEILKSLIPVSDVTFNVFCGYLYTQFFDINAVEKDFWNILSEKASNKISQKIIVENLAELDFLENDEQDLKSEIITMANGVIDFRSFNKPVLQENERQTVIRGTLIDKADFLSKNSFYIIKMNDTISIRIWFENALYLTKEEGNWQYETVGYNIETNLLLRQMEKWIQTHIDSTVILNKSEIYATKYFEKMFDVINGSGYCWAFNKNQSIKDPTNLFNKNTQIYLNCSYWGFAWFSAAYSAYNVINNQMIFTKNQLKIFRKKN